MLDGPFDAWPEPPANGSDVDTMIGSLERQRATFAWKAFGLDAAGLRATVGASSLTIGGLLKHLALVEETYFSVRLHGDPYGEPWTSADENDPDWVFTSAADDSPADLYALWTRCVERSRTLLADALTNGGLDQPLKLAWPDGSHSSIRRMLTDLIEEYGRHVGHTDLIRESIDGLVGEDPPNALH
jgi:hypothetical protein